MTNRREHELLEQVRVRDEKIKEQELQVGRLTDELRRSQTEIELLKHKLDRALRRLLGKISEQLDPKELQLLFEKLLENPAEVKEPVPPVIVVLPSPAKVPRTPLERKPRLPDHLPVVEETILPAQVQAARNYYDDAGRLYKTIDAKGNETDFTHDIAGRTETLKDRAGNITVHKYDERGNITYTKAAATAGQTKISD